MYRAQQGFAFSKPGFESSLRGYDISADQSIDFRLQPRLEMSAGDTLTATAYPDDPFHYMDFWGETECEPCKLVRVNVPSAGTLEVRLTLSVPSSEFGLAIETNRFARDVGCCKSEISGAYAVEQGQVKLFVYRRPGPLAGNQALELTTALR